MRKIGIIFNQSAGSFKNLHRDPKEWIDEIKKNHSFNDVEFDVRIIPAKEIDSVINEFISYNYDVITASGGDGTINGVASLVRNSDSSLGVIPSGTFNHFAKDVGIPLDFEEAVLNLVNEEISYIDFGSVNDKIFLNNSSIGQYPIAVLVREVARKRKKLNKKFAMALAVIKTALANPLLTISTDSKEVKDIETPLVFIGNNYYDISPLNIGKRKSLTEGNLYAYGSKCKNIFCSLHVAALAFYNQLKLTSKFVLTPFTEGTINSKNKRLAVAVDGEIFRMKTPLHYKMNHKVLKIILPKK